MDTVASEIKVLALVGSRSGRVKQQLAKLSTKTAPDGVTVTTFGGLGDLPLYKEDIDTADIPDTVIALRAAAADAHAAVVLTPGYHGRIPSVLRNAIDWLSRPDGQYGLHDKPLAVIGAAAGRYGGVWSHREVRDASGTGPRIVEPITAADLGDVVGKLAAEVSEARLRDRINDALAQ
jgi:NAD(P)H-dependent FMN reductase